MAELTENLIRLRTVHGVGNAILWRLLRHFGDSDRVLGAREEELVAVKGVTKEKARLIAQAVAFDPRPEMERAVAAGVDIIPYDDPGYPQPLLHSFDPPTVLYVRGTLTKDDWVAVGIVGTRRASPYGRDNAVGMAEALARGGYTIVSGLARGVDTFAHIGALNAGGRTVGVLGCGFDYMYPEENRDLALEMTRRGAVISEFTMGTPPSRETFPTRNRIIAGMGMGLLVIEAPLRSGSLITARLANEIGRTVFALPGRVDDPRSEGCNKLIRDGATMVTTVDDIFCELNPSLPLPPLPVPKERPRARRTTPPRPALPFGEPAPASVREKSRPRQAAPKAPPQARPNPKLNAEQQAVLAQLRPEWSTVDDITAAAGLPAGKTVAALAMLRMMRLAEQGPGQVYRLAASDKNN